MKTRERNVMLPSIRSVSRQGDLRRSLLDLGDCIVDTPGRDSRELRSGITVADWFITPFRPSQFDLETLPHIVQVLEEARRINAILKPRAVLSMAPTHPRAKEIQESRDYFALYPQLPLLNAIFRDRKVYRDALADGKGVTEMNNPAAKKELLQFMEELF